MRGVFCRKMKVSLLDHPHIMKYVSHKHAEHTKTTMLTLTLMLTGLRTQMFAVINCAQTRLVGTLSLIFAYR